MDKRASSIAKGIAIVLMFIHHLFYSNNVLNRRINDYTVLNYAPLGNSRVILFSQLCKVCVAIFVFVTAYGTYKQVSRHQEKTNYANYSVQHYIKLIGSKFPILLVFGLLGLFTGYKNPVDLYFSKGLIRGVIYMLFDILCLSHTFATPMMNPAWWYLSLAVLWIFLIPILVPVANRYGSVFLLALSVLLPSMAGLDSSAIFWRYLPTAMLGLLYAQYDLFERSREGLSNKALRLLILVVVGVSACLFKMRIPRLVFLFEPIVACVTCAFAIEIASVPLMSNVLDCLGIHSSNMYMTHNLLLGYYLTDIIYSASNWILITCLFILISLIVSLITEFVKKKSRYDKLLTNLAGMTRFDK